MSASSSASASAEREKDTPQPHVPGNGAANIRVYVRVRPLNARELATGASAAAPCLSVVPASQAATAVPSRPGASALVQLHARPDARYFAFDHVADARATQEDVFERVGRPITEACLAGYNGTIFAYGQTGSGKTFTIQGVNDAAAAPASTASALPVPSGGMSGIPSLGAAGTTTLSSSSPNELRGLMPRVFEYLTAQIAREESRPRSNGSRVSFSLKASFLEIYNERCFDLLDASSPAALPLREDVKKGVYVEGLMEVAVRSAKELQQLMEKGIVARRVGETAMNRESSRSHCVFTLHVASTTRAPPGSSGPATVEKRSRFNMIDLAGSERAKHTQATGARMDEARNINKSLSALGNVIRELMKRSTAATAASTNGTGASDPHRDDAPAHVPYRDSKLTFLLRDSLGGNSLTWLVACVSSAGSAFFESMSTLKFAQMANSVTNNARVNAEEHLALQQQALSAAAADALKSENEKLKAQLQRMMAAQSLGARRLSMMPGGMAAGLVTPTKLLPGGASTGALSFDSIAEEDSEGLVPFDALKTPGKSVAPSMRQGATEHEAAVQMVTPSTALQLSEMASLLEAASAREEAWAAELRAHREQIELLERKQEHDGMLLRIRDKLVASLRASAGATPATAAGEESEALQVLRGENSTLQAELATMSSSVAAVTHAPNILALHERLRLLQDKLEELQEEEDEEENFINIGAKQPRHHVEAQLQAQILALSSKHAALSASYAASLTSISSSSSSANLSVLATPARRNVESQWRATAELEASLRRSEAALNAEKDMVSHLEAQLEHALEDAAQKQREAEEALLLQKGVALRSETERASLARSLAALEAAQAEQTRALVEAQGSHSAEVASLSATLRAEVEQWRARAETAQNEREREASEHFDARQKLTLLTLQHERLEASLAAATKAAEESKALRTSEAAQATKVAEQLTSERDDARAQIESLQSQLSEVQETLSSRSAALSAAESDASSWQSRATALREELDAAMFRLDGVQEDIDTLNQEFGFQAAQLEQERLERTKGAEALAEKTKELQTLQTALVEREESLAALKTEFAAAQRVRAEASEEARAAEELRASMAEAQAALTERLRQAEADNDDLSEQLAGAQAELVSTKDRFVALQAEQATSSRTVAELTAALQDYSSRLASTASSLDTSQRDLSAAQESVTDLAGQNESLALENAQLAQENSRVQVDLQEVQQELVRAEEQLRDSVAQNEKTVSALATTQQALEDTQRQLAASQAAESALASSVQAREADLVSLRDELALKESESAESATQLAAAKQQLEHIHALVSQQQHGAAEAQQRQSVLNAAAVDAVRAEATSARAQAEQAVSDLARARQEFASARQAFEQKQSEFASLLGSFEGHRAKHQEELAHLRKQLAAKEASLAQAQVQLTQAAAERSAAESAATALKQQLSSVSSELSTAREQVAVSAHDSAIALSLQGEVSALSDRVEHLLRERKAWLSELESTRADEAQAISAQTNLAAQLSTTQEALAHAQEKLAAAQGEVSALAAQNVALAGHQNTRQKIQLHQQIKKENDTLRADKAALERELRKWRKMHALWAANGHIGGGSAAGSAANASMAALEKDLQLADEHLRAGEVAQTQLRALLAHVSKLEAKVRASAALHASAAAVASASNSQNASPASSRLTSPSAGPRPAPAAGLAALGDITNQTGGVIGATDASALAKLILPGGVIGAPMVDGAHGDPFALCLHALSGLAAQLCSSHTQVEALRRELNAARKQAKLQQLKSELHRAARRSSGSHGRRSTGGSLPPAPAAALAEDQENTAIATA